MTRYADRSGLPERNISAAFQAPALFVIGVNVLIPANWIFQPFFSRISEGGFNLRAHISLADTPVEISHEDNRRYLLQQSTVFGLRVWLSCIRNRCLPISWIEGRLGKDSGEVEKDSFRFGDIRECCVGVSELTFAALRISNSSRNGKHSFTPDWSELGASVARLVPYSAMPE